MSYEVTTQWFSVKSSNKWHYLKKKAYKMNEWFKRSTKIVFKTSVLPSLLKIRIFLLKFRGFCSSAVLIYPPPLIKEIIFIILTINTVLFCKLFYVRTVKQFLINCTNYKTEQIKIKLFYIYKMKPWSYFFLLLSTSGLSR